jgi:hypothetical protein
MLLARRANEPIRRPGIPSVSRELREAVLVLDTTVICGRYPVIVPQIGPIGAPRIPFGTGYGAGVALAHGHWWSLLYLRNGWNLRDLVLRKAVEALPMKLRVGNWAAFLTHTRLAEGRVPLSSLSYCSLSATLRCGDQDGETSPGLVWGPLLITWMPGDGGTWRLCGA